MGPRRPPGAGHPTRTRGGHHRGVGDPSFARPSLEPAGSSPLGHCGGTTHGRKSCLAGGSDLEEAGGWGVALSWGRGAPSRAGVGRELAAPSGCASRLRSDQAPGTRRLSRSQSGPLSLRGPVHSGTTEARVSDSDRRS